MAIKLCAGERAHLTQVFYGVFVFLDIPNRTTPIQHVSPPPHTPIGKSSSWLSYFDYYSTRIIFAIIILIVLTLTNRFIVWYHHRLARGALQRS